MSESRIASKLEQPITEYRHEDSETGEVFMSPFPVVAFTVEQRYLGSGKAIGQIDVGDVSTPVLEIDDETAPNGTVLLLGSECYWRVWNERTREALTNPRAKREPLSAREYVQGLASKNQAA